jgi:hypothetical protein
MYCSWLISSPSSKEVRSVWPVHLGAQPTTTQLYYGSALRKTVRLMSPPNRERVAECPVSNVGGHLCNLAAQVSGNA